MAVIKKSTIALVALYVIINNQSHAAVLAEDRIDVLYHNYDGGGITIDGPSVLVRKSIGNTTSISANYYIDSISSASIDAITQASSYNEKRTQKSISIDYLYDKSIMSYSYTNSTENDFEAVTHSFNISQETFGGLSTISLGYSAGNNHISKSTDNIFSQNADTKDYRLSLSQVFTKNFLMGLTYEVITDEGFLNNPYRQVRYISPSDPNATIFQDEKYPKTRTSNATSINFRYYLPYRAAVYGGYRYFTDTWDIEADTFDIGYVHPYQNNWIFDVSLRFYSQTRASFFSSLFPFVDAQNYLASDKELSTFSSNAISAGATYSIKKEKLSFFEKGTLNFYLDRFSYNYDDFLDTTVTGITPGTEPAYKFSANVIRFYLSLWF
ncbi:MAG: DUF3570 domain-containing protein [Gammaproteobacteria bacterium]|nr:DUF3570 domain-containing protein [Gammaproteobacteria bacterium]